jgi:hypothetical protein
MTITRQTRHDTTRTAHDTHGTRHTAHDTRTRANKGLINYFISNQALDVEWLELLGGCLSTITWR